MNKLLLCVLFWMVWMLGRAQTKSEIVQQRIEFISEQLETEELDLTNLFQKLTYYLDHPINLNNADAEQLRGLELLSEVQINDLLLHIKAFGKLISVYELQSLTYWDLGTIDLVLPFIRVDDKLDQLHVSLKEALKYGRAEVFLRYQTIPESKAGYADVPDSIKLQSNSYYWGNDDRYYTRLRFSYQTNLSIGVTAEKDPGEQFFKGYQKQGFDFYSAHAYYEGGKYVKAVALGDYQVQIGQGLNWWSGYAFGKTADVANVRKYAQPLNPYTSVDENRFMRGAAVDLGFKKFGLTLFGSRKRVDASLIADSLVEELEFVSSIDLSGFHRTTAENNKRNTLVETAAGGHLRYQNGGLQLGLAGIFQGYDRNYEKAIRPYNQFDFRGKSQLSVSADYSYVWRNMNFFGEISRAGYSGDFAQLHGVLLSLDSRAVLSLVYRNYDKGYQTFYNNGFGEFGSTQNEKGLYAGFKVKVTPSWTFNTYLDLFRHDWLRYLVDQPASGHEFLLQPTYKPNKQTEFYFRFRQQLRSKNSRDDFAGITPVEPVLQRNYRLNFSHQLSEGIQLKTRVEFVTVERPSNAPENGILFTQDVIFKPKSSPFDLALRYALFDTDSYDTRLYSFESNALYVFSVPAYYDRGNRAYFTLRYTFLRRGDLWIRYGVFMYTNRQTVGSGNEAINDNRKTDITVQLRWRF